MKFMLTFSIAPDKHKHNEAIARFLETSGKPPAGVTLLGRWTSVSFDGGVVLLESESAKALTEFSLMWSDIMQLRLFPVIEDAELAGILQREMVAG